MFTKQQTTQDGFFHLHNGCITKGAIFNSVPSAFLQILVIRTDQKTSQPAAVERSSCVLIAFLLQQALSGAAEAFRWFWVPPYKELKSNTDENIQALPAEWSSRRTGDTGPS